MKYVATLLAAIILAVILLPVGFVVRIFYKGQMKFLYKTAISIDQMGNVVSDKFFNAILIKSSSENLFGK